MDGIAQRDSSRRLFFVGSGLLVAAALVAWKLLLDNEGISLMSSDSSDVTPTTTTGPGTESCGAVLVPSAPEDIPDVRDSALPHNAYETIKSNQGEIAALKRHLASGSCTDQKWALDRIQVLREEIARIRSGVVPIRPPYDMD